MLNPNPCTRVLVANSIPVTFEVNPLDTYVDIYTQAERDAIVSKYQTPNLFNGSCVRLDSLVNGHAVISPVCFYDFLCCNIVGIHNKDPLAWAKMSQVLEQYRPINAFTSVLNIKELPNIIGVSTLLHDIDNNYLLVERNTQMSIGSGLFACTSSGSLCVDDTVYNNPIVGCALRELKEELGIQCQLAIEGACIPIQKLQPIVLLTGVVNYPWRSLIPQLIRAQDFRKENTRLLVVPKDDLLSLISCYSFTDAAAFHVYFEAGGSTEKYEQAAKRVVRLTDYIV